MVKPRPIPEIREEMLMLANVLKEHGLYDEMRWLRRLAHATKRRKPKYPRAAPTRSSLTKELKAAALEMKERNPTMANRDIGEALGIDGGRVSEAIHNVKC